MSRARSLITRFAPVALCALLGGALFASRARAQVGASTDVILGRVTGPDSLPLVGARVDVTSVESGITRTKSTDADGRYSIVFPDGGGQYLVLVRYVGMAPTRVLVRRQADEDRLVANVALASAPAVLTPVTVEAQRIADSLAAGAGAMGQVLSQELLNRLGALNDDARALAVATPGVTLMPGSDTSLSGISIGGQNPLFTGQTVDGAQSGGAKLPREAVRSTTVATSAFDVSQGGFAAGFVNQTTVSGTNQLRGTVNYYGQPRALQFGSTAATSFAQKGSGIDGGGNLSGPLRKDHLFFAMALHAGVSDQPPLSIYNANPEALERMGVVPDSVARFLEILDGEGLAPPPGFFGADRRFDNKSGFARIDWSPSEKHTLTINGSAFRNGNTGTSAPLSTPASVSTFHFGSSTAFASLTSHLGSVVNEARISASEVTFGSEASLVATSGRVTVGSSIPSADGRPAISNFSFGGNSFAPQETRTRTFEVKDEISWLSKSGAHRYKLGGSLIDASSTGGVPGNRTGTFIFNSLADLADGKPASFTRTLAPTDQRSATWDGALYAGDAWRQGPKLQLTYGVRLEGARFANAPAENDAVASAFGYHTSRFPSEASLSPRVGFTYFHDATDAKPATLTVRGGVGLFRVAASQVASNFASARNATGLPGAQATLVCVGAAVPTVDWSSFTDPNTPPISQCADGSTGTGTTTQGAVLPRVTVIDPGYEVPRFVRGALGVSKRIGTMWNASLDESFTASGSQTGVRDLNLVAAPRFSLASEGGRPVFVAPSAIVPGTGAISLADSRLDPRFGTVMVVSSGLRNWNSFSTASLSRNTPKLSVQVSFSYSYSRMQAVGFSGVGSGFFFGGGGTTAGDPRRIEWITNPFGGPSFRTFLSYRPKPWLELTPSFFMQRGPRYEPVVGSDINGDGAVNDRAFIFDPKTTSDTAIANGMNRLLASAPARVRDCLRSQLGRVAGALSCSQPWYAFGDLSVKVTPPWQGNRLSIALGTNNALSGLDQLLHGENNLHGWGVFPQTDRTLLYVRGFDPSTQRYVYQVNERFGTTNPEQNPFRQPFAITLQVSLQLGKTGGGPNGAGGPMMMIGGAPPAPGAPGAPGAKPGADANASLRARLAATVPNVHRRTLALNDSLKLALTAEQSAKLRALGDAYQPKADSLVDAIVTTLNAPAAKTDPAAVAAQTKTKTAEAQALLAKAIDDLRGVLTPEQFAKLPGELRGGKR